MVCNLIQIRTAPPTAGSLSNMSTLALRSNQEPHDRFPFFSSLPSVSGQAATSTDGHGCPMPECRRPRTRRRPNPLHAIPISLETCTKSHPAPAPPFGPRPTALQPERFISLTPEAEKIQGVLCKLQENGSF